MVGTGGGGQVCLAMVGVTVDSPVLVGSDCTASGAPTADPTLPSDSPTQPIAAAATAHPNTNITGMRRKNIQTVTSSKIRYRRPRDLMHLKSRRNLHC